MEPDERILEVFLCIFFLVVIFGLMEDTISKGLL